jgi:hypothetical protein
MPPSDDTPRTPILTVLSPLGLAAAEAAGLAAAELAAAALAALGDAGLASWLAAGFDAGAVAEELAGAEAAEPPQAASMAINRPAMAPRDRSAESVLKRASFAEWRLESAASLRCMAASDKLMFGWPCINDR